MLEKTGIPTNEQVLSVFPDMKRIEQGPVAIIECFQRIPCNPCQTACRMNAIAPFEDINDTPTLDFDKCNGCGVCISKCPGLAIMVIDWHYSPYEFVIRLPYEFVPLPKYGDKVQALDREGNYVCEARVDWVWTLRNKANVVSIVIPKDNNVDALHKVRHIKQCTDDRPRSSTPCDSHAQSIISDRNTCTDDRPRSSTPCDSHAQSIICRCSDITITQIQDLISQGFTTIDEIKRASRLGMGPCQGRNCVPLVMAELSRATGKTANELNPGASRPVVKSISLGTVAEYEEIPNDKEVSND